MEYSDIILSCIFKSRHDVGIEQLIMHCAYSLYTPKMTLPVHTNGNASDYLIISQNQTGRMYFQTPFPVPSMKQLSAKFLHDQEGLQSFCSTSDFCHHNYFGH